MNIEFSVDMANSSFPYISNKYNNILHLKEFNSFKYTLAIDREFCHSRVVYSSIELIEEQLRDTLFRR